MNNNENMIEFLSGQQSCTVTFTNRKHISRIKKIYETRKDEFKYYHENSDGSIVAKIPLKWIRINPGQDPSTPKREMSEERKAQLAAGLAKYRQSKNME